VPGAYAQKTPQAIERLLVSSSGEGDIVTDFFLHSAPRSWRRNGSAGGSAGMEIDRVFAELSIRSSSGSGRPGRRGGSGKIPSRNWPEDRSPSGTIRAGRTQRRTTKINGYNLHTNQALFVFHG
jgi:hypothetical protein